MVFFLTFLKEIGMYTTEQLKPHVAKTRRILGEIIASAGTAIAGPGDTGSTSNVANVTNHSNPSMGGSGESGNGGTGGGGSGGSSSFWGNFFEGLTFGRFAYIMIGILSVLGGIYQVTHDVQPNKHAEAMAYQKYQSEQEKTAQMKIQNGGGFFGVSSRQKMMCSHISSPIPGQSYLIPKGKCIEGVDSPEKIAIAAASPLTSITGGDFIVYSGDGSSSCDSRIGQDRCVEWMKQNRVIGNVDSHHKIPRYWYHVQTFGKININSL